MARTIARDTTVSRVELEKFIRPRHNGILITTRRDGSPQASPVAMGLDADGRVVIASYPERAKSKNAQTDPQTSVCVLSDRFGDDWVQVYGSAEVLELPDAVEPLVEYFRVIAGEHSDWDDYRKAMVAQGKVLIRVTIEKWGPISRGGFPAHLA
jgi:PPOX class probable F420-dependent enzyme